MAAVSSHTLHEQRSAHFWRSERIFGGQLDDGMSPTPMDSELDHHDAAMIHAPSEFVVLQTQGEMPVKEVVLHERLSSLARSTWHDLDERTSKGVAKKSAGGSSSI